MKTDNIVVGKSFDFSIKIYRLSKELEQKREYILRDQILRSGTSIGANIEEAQGSRSKAEFISKISIAYSEARETRYWLRLMRSELNIEGDSIIELLKEVDELLKILGSILKSLKR